MELVTTTGIFYQESDKLNKIGIFFDDWVRANFKSDVTVDTVNSKALIRENVTTQTLDQEALLSWAIFNLRCFDYSNFDDDLLLKSPRELGSNEEREVVYAKSAAFAAADNRRIDYFISHSWVDNRQKKCQALRSFSEKFMNQQGRHPTYWFDKTCIDQSKVNDNDYYALAVLPINIAACNKILVLLGTHALTYSLTHLTTYSLTHSLTQKYCYYFMADLLTHSHTFRPQEKLI